MYYEKAKTQPEPKVRRADPKRDPRVRNREQGRKNARAAKYVAQGRKG